MGIRENVRSEGYIEASNVLLHKLDFQNLCVLILWMWYTPWKNNVNKSIKK